jgi:hypothetical protein
VSKPGHMGIYIVASAVPVGSRPRSPFIEQTSFVRVRAPIALPIPKKGITARVTYREDGRPPGPPSRRRPDILSIEACRLRSWLAAARRHGQPARGSRQHPGAAHRRVLAQAAGVCRAGLPRGGRLHGPGNWATDLAGGSRYGYTLLSVIMLSNLMAILLQALSARLGIVSGRDLAQACRDHFSLPERRDPGDGGGDVTCCWRRCSAPSSRARCSRSRCCSPGRMRR